MDYYKKCPKCKGPMKQIPIKRLDLVIIIEFYCENCDESIMFYPNLGEAKFEHTEFF